MEQISKKWLWVLAAAVLVLLGWWMWQRAPQATAPSESAVSEDDTTLAIEQELNATDFGDLEAELQGTEADLQSL